MIIYLGEEKIELDDLIDQMLSDIVILDSVISRLESYRDQKAVSLGMLKTIKSSK